MASLNTLRTKFGVVLSIVIGLALLAFVLSLKTEMGFSGNDPKVGEIAGEKINYSEYMEAYDNVKMLQPNASEGDAQQADMLADAAWQQLLAKYTLTPGFEKMGLKLSEAERISLIRGERVTRTIFNAFADPNTGTYQREIVNDFLLQAKSNPEVRRMWTRINDELQFERGVDKFISLLKAGAYANKLEVAQGVASANNIYTGVWTGKQYSQVPDSLFNISSSEIRSYYDEHKNMFRQQPSRTISYVAFDVDASSDDMMNLTNTVNQMAAEFAAADDIRAFIRGNRNGRIDDRYVSVAQLPADEAEALMAGKMYGPQLKHDTWLTSRVVDSKMVPDTLWIRHVVLPFNQEALADSLHTELRKGADFEQTAMRYSVYGATATQGGEVGAVPFAAFQNEFVDALIDAKRGDVVKIVSGEMLQLVQVYRTGKPMKHLRVASVRYPVEASSNTRRQIHSAAATFAANAAGSVEKFNEAVAIAAVTPRVASIAETERQVRGLEDSREIVRWAYGAEKGDVSEIFNVEGDYVVAILTDIDENRYTSLKKAEPRIRSYILDDKKYDYILKNASGTTYDQWAQSLDGQNGEFSQVTYPSFYIQNLGVEPRLVGAVTSTEQGAFTAPVKGKSGLYVLRVDEVVSEPKQSAEAEKVRAQAAAESMMEQRSLQAIQQMADVKDLRNPYF